MTACRALPAVVPLQWGHDLAVVESGVSWAVLDGE